MKRCSPAKIITRRWQQEAYQYWPTVRLRVSNTGFNPTASCHGTIAPPGLVFRGVWFPTFRFAACRAKYNRALPMVGRPCLRQAGSGACALSACRRSRVALKAPLRKRAETLTSFELVCPGRGEKPHVLSPNPERGAPSKNPVQYYAFAAGNKGSVW